MTRYPEVTLAPLASSRRVQTGCPAWMRSRNLPHGAETKRSKVVRVEAALAGKSSKRVQTGEPNNVFQDVRYLIDFITSSSDVSPGLTPFDCDPGVDSNS